MSERVSRIFAEVYKNYDTVNTVCSLGTIVTWRKTAAREAMVDHSNYALLDIATGTGELAFEIMKAADKEGKRVKITAMDFSPNMLKVAKSKATERGAGIRFELGDAMDLRYQSSSFDVVTSSFALRNVDDLETFAREAYRVMKKGGKFVFMDMARPESSAGRLFIKAYWTVIGAVGLIENRDAYLWLVSSVDRFDKHGFVRILQKQGFRNVKMSILVSGAAFLVTGNK
ncbi:MAG: ubiquinone/menaquinone biosynthesis methyltransferase [Candidatus Micrarchaeota archaeon]|nr:ubiquinone/menaquinone biosynthesis methyltransferase [Candidatus Micrarchaeota archaeon]